MPRLLQLTLALLGGVSPLLGQDLQDRVQRLEEQNRELLRRLDAVDIELERNELGSVIPALGEGKFGLGPAASKVYGIESGVSIGGYGEYVFEQRSGQTDRFDALRWVLYVGHKFNENWVFNSEIEIEHGSTSTSSGTTSSGGSVSLEFGAIEYLHSDAWNLRAGLLLVPMGLINEYHEPTTFLSAQRPDTEQRIIPSTWRAMGIGAFGDVGGFSYRAYLIQALDGEEFDAAGLRGGRQKGNRAAADDFAGVLRLDYTATPGLLAGVSGHYGKTAQDGLAGGNRIPALGTWIVDAHVDYQSGPFRARALAAIAAIDGAGEFNAMTGENLAKRLDGYYVELGYDVMPLLDSAAEGSLTPFFRYEHIDTQASMPAGYSADASREEDILTFGVNFQPIDQVVIKADFEDREAGNDAFRVLLGYIF